MKQKQEVVNVICMKWGTKFPAHDVNVLHAMVKRHLTLPHRFVCLTDDRTGLVEGIECFDLPEIEVPKHKDMSPWRKLGMLSKKIGDLKGKALFLDLDLVIMDNIDCFFTYSDKLSIIENWTQKGQGVGNSAVYCFELGKYSYVLDYYNENKEEVFSKYSNEQIYLSKKIGDIKYWPDSWCRSFKRHCIPSYIIRYFKEPVQPKGVKIVVFHGKPTIPEAIKGSFYGNFLKYVRSTKWIADNWKL